MQRTFTSLQSQVAAEHPMQSLMPLRGRERADGVCARKEERRRCLCGGEDQTTGHRRQLCSQTGEEEGREEERTREDKGWREELEEREEKLNQQPTSSDPFAYAFAQLWRSHAAASRVCTGLEHSSTYCCISSAHP
eukprot:1351569-Rhodomonas_salina.1